MHYKCEVFKNNNAQSMRDPVYVKRHMRPYSNICDVPKWQSKCLGDKCIVHGMIAQRASPQIYML